MDFIKEVIQRNNPVLYQRCQAFPTGIYTTIYKYGLVSRDDLCSKIHKLKFRSNKPYMFHEVLELVHSENREALSRPILESLGELKGYLNSTGFQHENYTLTELIEILRDSLDHWPPWCRFGYPSTDPTIVDFIESLTLKAFRGKIPRIESRLDKDAQNISKALQSGVSYKLMAEMLLKNHDLRILNSYPLIFEDKKVMKLFLKLSGHCSNPISPDTGPESSGIKDFLKKLPYLPDKKIAMEKMLLMIYFPEDAQLIYNSDPIYAFKSILTKKLTKWRRDIAESIDWESDRLGEIKLFNCHFGFTKNYYSGYRENSMFDDFILTLKGALSTRQLKEIFSTEKSPEDFFRGYKRSIVEDEFQGTIYSVIQNRYKLKWGLINPLNEKVNSDFETEYLNKMLSIKYRPSTLWLSLKYIEMASTASVPISRLIFDSRCSLNDLVLGYCVKDQEENVRIFRRIYKSLAKYCQPKKGYRKRWDSYARDCEFTRLFDEIWERIIEHCNLKKSLNIIMTSLERDDIDLLTRKLLLQILNNIVKTHYSVSLASKMDFTAWTNLLKDQLCKVFGKSKKLASCKNNTYLNGSNGISLKTKNRLGCIIA